MALSISISARRFSSWGRLSALFGLPSELREPRRALIVLPRLASMPSALRALPSYWADQWSTAAVVNLSDHDVVRIVGMAIETGRLHAAVLPRIVPRQLVASGQSAGTAVPASRAMAPRPPADVSPLRFFPVSQWRVEHRVAEVIRRTIPNVPGDVGAKLPSLLPPERLALVAGNMVFSAAPNLTRYGWAADAITVGIAFGFGGLAAIHALASNKLILEHFGKDIPDSKKQPSAAEIVIYQSDKEFKGGLKARHPGIEQRHTLDFIKGEMYDGKIFLNKHQEPKWVITHEQLHYYSSERFFAAFADFEGVRVDEGVTEYFNRQITREIIPGVYMTETAVAVKLAKTVGEDTLKKAYFGGDELAIERVRQALSPTEQATQHEMSAARAEQLKQLKVHQEQVKAEQEAAGRPVRSPAYAALRYFEQNGGNAAFEQSGTSSAAWPEASNQLIQKNFDAYIPENKKTPSAADVVIYQSDEEFKDGFKARCPNTWQLYPLDHIHGVMSEGKIFINNDKSSAMGEEGKWTATHEQLHYYQTEKFAIKFQNFQGVNLTEGVTEYFS